jgi:hypothetical protein
VKKLFTFLVCPSDQCRNATKKHKREQDGSYVCLNCGSKKFKHRQRKKC